MLVHRFRRSRSIAALPVALVSAVTLAMVADAHAQSTWDLTPIVKLVKEVLPHK
jgi:uncharacterized protein YqfB (UPF0267 family)